MPAPAALNAPPTSAASPDSPPQTAPPIAVPSTPPRKFAPAVTDTPTEPVEPDPKDVATVPPTGALGDRSSDETCRPSREHASEARIVKG